MLGFFVLFPFVVVVVFFFFCLAIFAFLHTEPNSLKVTQISYTK